MSRYNVALGKNIRSARRNAKMTQEVLGRAIGVKRLVVTNIEAGRRPVDVELLTKIAIAFRVEFTSLLPDVSAEELATVLKSYPPEVQEWIARVVWAKDRPPAKKYSL